MKTGRGQMALQGGVGGTVDRLDVKWPCVQPLGVSPSRNTPAEVVF